MTEETRISKEINDYALANGIWQLARYQAQSNLNGIPDRLYLYKGVLLGIEVKTPKGKPTELQKRKLRMINKHGGVGVLVDNVKQFIEITEAVAQFKDPDFKSDEKLILEKFQGKYPHLSIEEKESV